MRLLLITACLMTGFALLSPAAHAAPGAAPDVSPNTAPSGQPPFGGTFESRLERLGADVEGGAKQGWLTAAEARRYAGQVTALRTELKAVRDRNGGKFLDADNSRLQDRVTALHKQMADAAAAAKSRRANR